MGDLPEEVESEFQSVIDSWPEDAEDDSYSFFVGGATSASKASVNQQSLSSQLMGVGAVKDLKEVKEVPGDSFTVEDDLESFAVDRIKIVEPSQYEDLFFAVKKRVFNDFDFLRIMSVAVGDVPLTERDLVLNPGDFYIIEYLKDITVDYFAVMQLAHLYALDSMCIDTVRFVERDGCPLCKAHDGVFHSVRYLMDLISSGESLSHPYCECRWDPIIYRERYRGPLYEHLRLDTYTYNNLEIVGMPVELKAAVETLLDDGFDEVSSVKFLNISDYILNEVDNLEDSSGVVTLIHEGSLIVHHSYVDLYGPVDFIREFKKSTAIPSVVDVSMLKGTQVYFISGTPAYFHKGKYWDCKTGNCLS